MKNRTRIFLLAAIGLAFAFATASAATFTNKNRATLRALDKITGRSTDIVVKVGEPVVFGSLRVELKACFQTPPEEVPESAAFLKIESTKPVGDETLQAAISSKPGNRAASTGQSSLPVLFSGWMFASSPGLNALEHPVYDVWVIRCTAPEPVKLPERYIIPDTGEPLIDDLPSGVSESATPIEPDMSADPGNAPRSPSERPD